MIKNSPLDYYQPEHEAWYDTWMNEEDRIRHDTRLSTHRTLTEEQISKIIELRNSGSTLGEIAKRFGVSKEWVRILINKNETS